MVHWGWGWPHSSRQQWERKLECRILRTWPASPAQGTNSRPSTAKPNRPWDCRLSWQQMDIHVCSQSEVWSQSLSNPQKCCLLPTSITTVLSGWNHEYQTFIQTLGATLDLHWNNTNVTEVRVWQWVNRNRNNSISCKGDKEICHALWCDRKSKKAHENRQTQNIFCLFLKDFYDQYNLIHKICIYLCSLFELYIYNEKREPKLSRLKICINQTCTLDVFFEKCFNTNVCLLLPWRSEW